MPPNLLTQSVTSARAARANTWNPLAGKGPALASNWRYAQFLASQAQKRRNEQAAKDKLVGSLGYAEELNRLDPDMIALNRQAAEDRADLELRAQEEQAADSRDAAARQNQLALAMATRRRAPGGGLVMGGGTRRGGVAIGQTGGGLSRANAEVLKKARMGNLTTKHSARADELYSAKLGTSSNLAAAPGMTPVKPMKSVLPQY